MIFSVINYVFNGGLRGARRLYLVFWIGLQICILPGLIISQPLLNQGEDLNRTDVVSYQTEKNDQSRGMYRELIIEDDDTVRICSNSGVLNMDAQYRTDLAWPVVSGSMPVPVIEHRTGNQEMAALHPGLSQPFWEKTWFYLVELLFAAAFITFVAKRASHYRSKKKEYTNELQKKIRAERERVSRDIQVNVGTQLTTIITGLEQFAISHRGQVSESAQEQIDGLLMDARQAKSELRETLCLNDLNTDLTFHLTTRERELLAMITEDLTENQIADKMYISPHTVRTHIKNIYKKLQVHSRSAAVRLALQKKLV